MGVLATSTANSMFILMFVTNMQRIYIISFAHDILLDTLTEQDLFIPLQIMEPATPKWKLIGLALGFLLDSLTVIQQKTMLIPEGDSGYTREMLNQWLKWAPPNHKWPTLSALETALHNCQEESLAATLRARFMRKRVTCTHHGWVAIA